MGSILSSSVATIAAVASVALLAGCDLPTTVGERGVLSDARSPAALNPGGGGVPAGEREARRRQAPIESLGQAAIPTTVGRTGRVLPVASGDRDVQLDYADADAARVAREVVGDVLGLPVAVDPGVAGRITLRTEGRVPLSEVPRRLDQALQPLGFGIAAVGGQVRVGRIADLEAPGSDAAGEARLIPLRNVSPSALLPVLRQNAPDTVRLTAEPAGRGLLAIGPRAGVDAVEDLVRLFDVDTLRSRSFGLYPLANASPAAVMRELGTIYGDPGRSGVRFAPIDRLNAILVVADQPGALARVRQTLTQLDTTPAATANVHVYAVQYRRATELADILSRTFGGAPAQSAPRAGPTGGFGGLQLGSSQSAQSGVALRVPGSSGATLPADAPQPAAPDAVLNGGASAGQAQGTGQNTGQNTGPTAADLGLAGPVRVQADPGRNALVVLASATDYAVIEQTIRRLDVRPRQVFIEAVIAEVTLTDSLRYGIDASLRLGSNALTSAGLAATTGGFAYVLSGKEISTTIQALSAITDVKVVSAPRILVLDNETATLQVGNQVPILTRTATSTDASNAPVVNSVELRDTGVILAVRARIGSGGAVSLEVFQEVSDAVTTDSSTLNSPTIELRRLQSAINVQSGDTVALGGLMRDNSSNSRNGVPVLSRIPVLGALFGSKQQSVQRSELLVLLTPRIVDAGSDIKGVTDELRAKLNTLAPDLGYSITPPPASLRLNPDLPPPRAPRVNVDGVDPLRR